MAKKAKYPWLSEVAVNLFSNLVALAAGGIVTYLSHEGSTWVKPVMYGAGAWLLTFCSIMAARVWRRIPRRSEFVTLENAGTKIHGWLDEFGLTVQRINDPESEFFFLITTDGGKKIAVLRTKDQFKDYVLIRALIGPTDEEKTTISQLSDDEKIGFRLAVQLELARAVVGYKTENLLDGLTVFKRIPITPTLTTEEVFDAMWDIEAVVSSVYLLGAMSFHRHNMNKNRKDEKHETALPPGDGSTKEL
jgi:hypothetical protein